MKSQDVAQRTQARRYYQSPICQVVFWCVASPGFLIVSCLPSHSVNCVSTSKYGRKSKGRDTQAIIMTAHTAAESSSDFHFDSPVPLTTFFLLLSISSWLTSFPRGLRRIAAILIKGRKAPHKQVTLSCVSVASSKWYRCTQKQRNINELASQQALSTANFSKGLYLPSCITESLILTLMWVTGRTGTSSCTSQWCSSSIMPLREDRMHTLSSKFHEYRLTSQNY